MAAKRNKQRDLYGIGAVARLTGLTDHTIRVWERRYGAVVAQRAANRRRVFTAEDVEKLTLLKLLTDQAIPISQIADSSIEALRERAERLAGMASASMPERISVAVLGEQLPTQVRAHERDLDPLDIRISDSNRERFLADLGRHSIDVIVLELATVEPGTVALVRDLLAQSGAQRSVLVYRYARARDVERVRDSRVVVLRAPVDVDEVRAAVLRAYEAVAPGRPRVRRPKPAPAPEPWQFDGPAAPRRFSQQRLAELATASTGVDCECPRHLVRLVIDLSAFEVYSAQCASRGDDDAALHAYLQQASGQARAMIEQALEKLVQVEGL